MREKEVRSRSRAKTLRRRMTDAEVILWSRLRRHMMQGRKFRRQHPIGPYIADFACLSARLIIELDGATHGSDAEIDHDRRRAAFLKRQDWRIVRIPNEEIYKNLDVVLEIIFVLSTPSVRLSATTSPVNGGGKN